MDVATQLQPAPSSPPSNTSQEPHLYQREQGDVFVAHTEDGGGYSDNFAPIDVDIPVDVDMEGANLVLAPEEEEVEQAEPLNWNIALHRTILLHSTEEARISTLQLLMTVTFVDPDHSRVYGNALTNILDVLAGIPNHPVRDFGQTAETVCKAFCSMATRLALSTKVSVFPH
ncbi:hypothetical protein ID866_514 [Astraeus odoratus]|nr:hypothetical protein ID866_514 [Astraeus odoratus]